MSMEQFISSYFADAQAPVQDENLEKQAQAELFAKLAAENGIDLEKLSEAQIEHLWTETFSTKEAEFPPPKEEKKDEKKPLTVKEKIAELNKELITISGGIGKKFEAAKTKEEKDAVRLIEIIQRHGADGNADAFL